MTIDPIATGLPLSQTPGKKDAKQTASDFEALMIGQMLKSARSDSKGWFGTGEDSSSASLIDLAEDQIARVLAEGGGLGLGKFIEGALSSEGGSQKTQADSSTVQMSGKLR